MNVSYPDVSIIIPTFVRSNDVSQLDRCLGSLKQQAYAGHIEIIVVDDASPNPSAIQSAVNQHHAIYACLDINSGPGLARNQGAEIAKGQILAFIDSDCVAPDNWISQLIEPIIQGQVFATTSSYSAPVHRSWFSEFQNDDIVFRMPKTRLEAYFVNSHSFAINRDKFLGIGGFPAQRISEDMVLGIRLAEQDIPALFVPEASIYHDYRNSLEAFLKQRYGFAYNTVAFFLERMRKPSQNAQKQQANTSFSIMDTLIGMASAGVFTISLIFLLFYFWWFLPQFVLPLTFMILFMAVCNLFIHRQFLSFSYARHGLKICLSYIPLLYLTDMSYFIAAIRSTLATMLK